MLRIVEYLPPWHNYPSTLQFFSKSENKLKEQDMKSDFLPVYIHGDNDKHDPKSFLTLLAQGIEKHYPLQNSISTKLFDTVALFLLLNKKIDTVYDMECEEDLKKFAKYLEENEKTVMNLMVQNFINNTKNDDVTMKLKNMLPKIAPNMDCLIWHLNFTTIANDRQLETDEQLGVIAVHKQKFMTAIKGPTAVKEVMKEQIFQDDEKHGEAPRTLMKYAKKFVGIQKEREEAYKKTLSRGDKYDLRDYYETKPTLENGAGNPRYKGKNYQQTKDRSLQKRYDTNVAENTKGGGNPDRKIRCNLCNNDIKLSNCVPERKVCEHSSHDDLKGAQWDKKLQLWCTISKYTSVCLRFGIK